MKRTIKFIATLALSAWVYQAGFAQDTNPNANQTQENTQDTDDNITQMAQKDLQSRYPGLDDQVVVWDRTEDGYNATYSMNDADFMARYDAEGNWLETMEKRDWDDNVPENIKMGLSDNAYENYKVDSYWEITDSDRGKGYLFYLKDQDGNTQNVRMDSQGTIINENDYNNPK